MNIKDISTTCFGTSVPTSASKNRGYIYIYIYLRHVSVPVYQLQRAKIDGIYIYIIVSLKALTRVFLYSRCAVFTVRYGLNI